MSSTDKKRIEKIKLIILNNSITMAEDVNESDVKLKTESSEKGNNPKLTINLKENVLNKNNELKNFKENDLKPKSLKRVTSRSANVLFLLLRIVISVRVCEKFMLILVLLSCVSAKEQKFAIEPQDQTAVVGSRVILPCRVVYKVGQLQWTKDDFGLGTHRHLIGYDRYKMIGSDEEGDYSLNIENVSLDDDALYQCQVSSGPHGEPPIRSRYARLLVLVAPDPPRILQGPIFQALEDQEIDLECVSIGGKPAAEITWVDHDSLVITQGVTYTAEPMADGRRFTARSILHLRPRRHHHNQTFTCQAQNTADRTYKATSIKLQVKYAPKVKLHFKSRAAITREGDTLVLGCQASANPNDLSYKWYVNNEELAGKTSNELVLSNITRDYNEATVKCEVHNSVGKSADSKTLEVAYGPTFKTLPSDQEGDLGTGVTLTCEVEGHPQPKIGWFKYEKQKLIRVGTSSKLPISVSQHTAGQYWCRASSDGRKDIEVSASVYLKGPPRIISNETQYGAEGDIVRIECIAFSVPKPDFVIWSFKEAEINSIHNQEYAFLEESLPDGMTKSTLIVKDSQARHFGTYNCTVANLYGIDTLEIDLIPEQTFPIILISSACISIAVFVLLIMLIIMLCHRKTSKNDEKKPDITNVGKTCPDQFKDSDSANISDLKMELRQIEGCDVENSTAGSQAELSSTTHLTTNLGLPLAGPVPLPEAGCDNELMKHYQRYSGDFNQAISNLDSKMHSQTNGYVPYVDYSRDYAPPSDSMTGSLTRSSESTFASHCGSLHRQASCGRLGGFIGPDVIPMANPMVLSSGIDARYAATYGNPYLRGSGPMAYIPQISPAKGSKSGPPPYYSIRTSNLNLPESSLPSTTSSRHGASSVASVSSSSSAAQPQVPKSSPTNRGLYVLPVSTKRSSQSNHITVRSSGNSSKPPTHV